MDGTEEQTDPKAGPREGAAPEVVKRIRRWSFP